MLSVVIPAWSGNEVITAMTIDLCRYVRDQCDELIVSEDGEYHKEIEDIADVYLQGHPRLGHVKNLNLGFEASTKDFVAMLDNDIRIESGNLRDLCVPEKLVYPKWTDWNEYPYPQTGQELWQWFVVAPRKFFQELPPFSIVRPEGLDEWGDAIRARFPILRSNKVSYRHSGKTSYGAARLPS
jgi:glycosyltransferase involved in cell wall biosynthesis